MKVYKVTKFFQTYDNSSIHIHRGNNGYIWQEAMYGYPTIFIYKENVLKWFETLGNVRHVDDEYFIDSFKYTIEEIVTFDELQ
jgi:hypothetical protein